MEAFPPRPWWRRVPLLSTKPLPPLSNFDKPAVTPEVGANFLSVLTFFWLDPLLRRGYTRPLDKDDLWSLPDGRSAHVYATSLDSHWNRRVSEAERFNDQRRPSSSSLLDDIQQYHANKDDVSRSRLRAWLRCIPFLSRQQRSHPRVQPSLVMAMNDTVFVYFWLGGLMKLLADVATITSPLLLRAITNFVSESYAFRQDPLQAPSLGKGVAMAVGLFLIQAAIVFLNVHSFYRSFGTGILLRSALIHATYRRAMRLSNKSRTSGGLGASKIVSLISADVSRIDFCCQYFHMAWTSIVQIIICLALLIYSLGYSALPGFACILILSPVQTVLTKHLFLLRKRSMKWTDRRIKAVSELMGGIRLIKQFAWEVPYIARISGYRKTELAFLRKRLLFRSLNISTSFATPTLAAVVSFVTYAGSGHDISQPGMAGVIFSSLTFFQLLRTPLQFLPVSWNAIADAKNAAKRIEAVFTAESRELGPQVNRDLPCALRVHHASFEWDSPAPDPTIKPGAKPNPPPSTNLGQPLPSGQLPASIGKNGTFCVEDISLTIPRGQLIAVVGGIGSGKSSLINALAGEMRITSGSVTFGGSVGMCAQTAWILSTSIRDNILFGKAFDAVRYDRVVRDCCLGPDFAMLPEGDSTVVGEKGVSLSGGQRQRINIARAVYHDDDVILFDDCFSALDAHVGEAVFRNVMLGSLAGKTRILATHALHLLSSVDYIITLAEGRIAEQGTYHRLIKRKGAFASFVEMYGGALNAEKRLRVVEEEQGMGPKEEDQDNGKADEESTISPPSAVRAQRAQLASEDEQKQTLPKTNEQQDPTSLSEPRAPEERKHAKGKEIMQLEERITGSVTRHTYADYFGSANLAVLLPLFIAAVLVFQGSTVMSPLWLLWWQQRKFSDVPTGVYMGVYAVLGCTQALGLLCMGAVFALFTFYSSMSIHLRALRRVVYAPVSFFDTTPLGRICGRFAKDVDVVDNIIGDAIRTFLGTVVQVIGSVVLIAYLTPYFLVAVGVLLFAYFWTGLFYRASSRELRRLDAVLRSSMYEHLSESLAGLSTIRAYGETSTFEIENGCRMDKENRAYWLSMACQRWLSIRLDFFGSLLVLAVALLAVLTRFTIQPGETGAALSYILTAQSVFSWMIRQSAEIENNMNAVERLLFYARSVEQEPEHIVPKQDDLVERSWPSKGHVRFENIEVSHRPGLEPVLKDVSFEVLPGQHVAICGRTGAGKSTMVSTLLRMMELSSGRILIDGVDISSIGLHLLRSRLSIIPQDALLFSGTMRYNLDPLGEHEDVELWDAMRRACLLSTRWQDFGKGSGKALDEDGVNEDELSNVEADMDDDTTLAPSRRSSLDASHIRRVGSAATSTKTLNMVAGEEEAEGDGVKEAHGLTLDSVIEEEGSNLSVGQRSLVSMARALVRHSRVTILDEATASIDYGTDRAVQHSISRDLAQSTVICIAHRLATIVGFDLVCVLDAGRIVEMGTPIDLWERRDGTFRAMCESSNIGREEINHARKRELRLRAKGLTAGGGETSSTPLA